MRISPVLSAPVRFGSQANDPLAQDKAEFAGGADYADGSVKYYVAVDEATNRAVVYVQSTRPDPAQALKDAPQKFSMTEPAGIQVVYKPYVEPKKP